MTGGPADEAPVDEDVAGPLRASNPNATGPDGAAGGMGVSSERVGHAGPRQTSTDGVRDNSLADSPEDSPEESLEESAEESPADGAPPEQAAGGEEVHPATVLPKAGYPSKDPRSKEHPYDAKPDV